jgi:hypothetical protein
MTASHEPPRPFGGFSDLFSELNRMRDVGTHGASTSTRTRSAPTPTHGCPPPTSWCRAMTY